MPQGNMATPCTLCKELKKRIRKMQKHNSELKDQLTESEKDYQQLQVAKIKIEGQLDILQDQLLQEEAKKRHLKQIVPHLQEAIILIEANCRAESPMGTSGAQRTLSRISELIHEQGNNEKVVKIRHHLAHPSDASKRDSALSTFSDISSVTESADEDRYSDSTSYPERNRFGTDLNKPIISDLHRYVTQNQIKSKSSMTNINQNEPLEQTEAASTQNLSSTVFIVQNQQSNAMESTKETHEEHTCSESSPMNGRVPNTPDPVKSDLNIQMRLPSSESGLSIKQNKSQGFRCDRKIIRQRRAQAQSNLRTALREHHSLEEPDELSVILSKRREKIDSENTLQQPVTYQSQ